MLVIISMVMMIGVLLLGVNSFVKLKVRNKIINVEDTCELEDVDCIIVLGAAVKNGNTPSRMLSDRLDKSLEVYKTGCTSKILVSGDHGDKYYNEVGVMKNYLIDEGVESSNIFMDHAGFSTYDTMYRAKNIFKAKKVVIVTQQYHLYRALYIAEKLGIEAYGVSALDVRYAGQTKRDIREFLAIDKDFVKVIFKPEAAIMGEEIPIDGDGDVTNDVEAQPVGDTTK